MKRNYRSILLLASIVLTAVVPFSAWSQTQEGSYREALLNANARPKYEAVLGQSCVAEVLKIYSTNQTLESKLIQESAKPIAAYSKKLAKGFPLYHYSNSPNLHSPNLSYLRSQNPQSLKMFGYSNTENSVVYVSTNPYTSSVFGKNLMTYWVGDNVRVLPFELMKNPKEVLAKLAEREPKFRTLSTVCRTGVVLIIYEESGIDLVDYSSGIIPGANWFYLLHAQNIQSSDFLETNKASSPLKENYQKEVSRINNYLKSKARNEEITINKF